MRREGVGDDSVVPDDAAHDVVELRTALAAAEARITALEQIIHDLRLARFGSSAESVDPCQLALALGAAPPPNGAAIGALCRRTWNDSRR